MSHMNHQSYYPVQSYNSNNSNNMGVRSGNNMGYVAQPPNPPNSSNQLHHGNAGHSANMSNNSVNMSTENYSSSASASVIGSNSSLNNLNSNVSGNKDKLTLFIGDLSTFCNEQQLADLLGQFGTVSEVKIMKSEETNRNLSYGFVKFLQSECAECALRLNGTMFMGRKLRVNWASFKNRQAVQQRGYNGGNAGENAGDGPDTSPVHVSYISYQLTHLVNEESLRTLFSQFGEVVDVSIKKSLVDHNSCRQSGYGFVHFDTTPTGIESAKQAAKYLEDRTLDDVNYKSNLSHKLNNRLSSHDPLSTAISAAAAANISSGSRDRGDYMYSDPSISVGHSSQQQQATYQSQPQVMTNMYSAQPNSSNVRPLYINTQSSMMGVPQMMPTSPHYVTMQVPETMHLVQQTQQPSVLLNQGYPMHSGGMVVQMNPNAIPMSPSVPMNGYMHSPQMSVRVLTHAPQPWLPSPSMSPSISTLSGDSLMREEHFLNVNQLLHSPSPALMGTSPAAVSPMVYPQMMYATQSAISRPAGYSPSDTPMSPSMATAQLSFNSDVVTASAVARSTQLASKTNSSARSVSSKARNRLNLEPKQKMGDEDRHESEPH